MKLNLFVKKICNYKFAQNFTCREKKRVFKVYCNKKSIKLKFMSLKAKKTSHLYNNVFIFWNLGVRFRIRKILVQTPLGAGLSLET